MFFSVLSTRHSTLDTRPFSLGQPVRPGEDLRRNRLTILDFRHFDIAQYRFWILDCSIIGLFCQL
jgi:hypothetical protein